VLITGEHGSGKKHIAQALAAIAGGSAEVLDAVLAQYDRQEWIDRARRYLAQDAQLVITHVTALPDDLRVLVAGLVQEREVHGGRVFATTDG
jgi:hypothetical protein